VPVQSALLFESVERIFARVFREWKPRTPLAGVEVVFRPFANANSSIRLEADRLRVRLPDVLEGAPAPILEALANILIAKLYRRPVPTAFNDRYRRYLNRREMRRSLNLLREIRGRKFVSGPAGAVYHLDEIFEQLNAAHFHGLMARPALGWSRQPSRTTLGHWDPSHNAIILSKLLDRPETPRLAVEYVLFHEMLHLRFPVDHRGVRRRVHTPEFRQAEKTFPRLREARELLRKL
jgi:hypothetical protein